MAPPKDRLETMRRLLVLMDGRDKSIKLVQYSAKVILWAYLSRVDATATTKSATLRLKNLASSFSTTRKIIRLGHVIEPYAAFTELCSSKHVLPSNSVDESLHRLAILNSIIGMVQDISDDLYCLCKIGVLRSKRISDGSEVVSAYLWLVGIWLDLHENWWAKRRVRQRLSELVRQSKQTVQAVSQAGVLDEKQSNIQPKPRRPSVLEQRESHHGAIHLKSASDAADDAQRVKEIKEASDRDRQAIEQTGKEIFSAKNKLYWLRISQYKLFCDLIFCCKSHPYSTYSLTTRVRCISSIPNIRWYSSRLWSLLWVIRVRAVKCIKSLLTISFYKLWEKVRFG